jgi:hypothetical protein
MKESLEALLAEGTIRNVDAEAMARMFSGASCYAAQWIANSNDPVATSKRAIADYRRLVEALCETAPAH